MIKNPICPNASQLMDVFTSSDHNHDGYLSTEDFHKSLESLGYTKKVIEIFDESKVNFPLNYDQYLHVLKTLSIVIDELNEIIEAFKSCDKHGTGVITQGEFRAIVTLFGEPTTEDEIDEILQNGGIVDPDQLIDIEMFVWTLIKNSFNSVLQASL